MSYSNEDHYNDRQSSSRQKLPNSVRISFLTKSFSEQKLRTDFIPDFLKNNALISYKCALCQEYRLKSEMQDVEGCSHTFCSICLHTYCIYKIDIMEEVTCPQQGCKVILHENSKIIGGLPQKARDKNKRNNLWRLTMNNPEIKLCPKQNCSGVINKSAQINQCNRCYTAYCKECQLVSHLGPCDDNFQATFSNWKRCPQCKIFIEKNLGCNQMLCRCGHTFCYVCLARWNSGHFKCDQNRLDREIEDFSRWKRLALGILIVLCSPILVTVYVVIWGISIVVSFVLGYIAGPVYLITTYPILDNVCCYLFWPLMMVIGAILAVIVAICLGIYFFGVGLKTMMQSMGTLLFTDEQQFFVEPELDFQQMGS